MNIVTRAPLLRRALRRLGRSLFDWAENNQNPRFATNGEKALLRHLLRRHRDEAAGRSFVAIDAGASRGDYCEAFLHASRGAGVSYLVYAFEPSAVCFEALRSRFADDGAVRLVSAALADQSGELDLFDGHSGSSLASLACRDPAARLPVARVRGLTLAEFIVSERIETIDLLKLDIEGAEFRALQGAGSRLHPEVIRVIQFEYGGTTRDAGVTLRDLYRLLEARGYRVGKLLSGGIELRRYQDWMETFSYANYVALPAAPDEMDPSRL